MSIKRFSLFLLFASMIMLALTVQAKGIFAASDQSATSEQALDVESSTQYESNGAQTELMDRAWFIRTVNVVYKFT
jgi:hypothetical protein